MTRLPFVLLVACGIVASAALVSAQESSSTEATETAEPTEAAPQAPAASDAATAHKFVGVKGCRSCHGKEAMGDQVSIWEDGPHANAMDSLDTGLARDWAREAGLGDPLEEPECIRCHTTGYGQDELKTETYDDDHGVSCEACHGAGSDYRDKDTMRDHDAAVAAGLVEAGEATCLECHNEESPAWSGFNYKKYFREIAHPLAEGASFDHPMVGRTADHSSCTMCHDSVPPVGSAPADAALSEGGSDACMTCHEGSLHAGAKQHVGKAATKAPPTDPQQFALAADGTIQCWTCHEVHGDGVGIASTRAADADSTVAAGIRAAALASDWAGLLPEDAVWPASQQSERRAMLTLPVDDGQLCAGCHRSGP